MGCRTEWKTETAGERFLRRCRAEVTQMGTFRKRSAEQEIKGTGQKIKGVGQEIAGRVTGDADLRAKGEANQVGGHVRSRVGEAGRKISDALDPEKPRRRR